MSNGIHNLTDHQKDQLLDFFFYHMPMEQRERLMAELPRAYNAACGRKIVEVRCVSRDEVLAPPLDKCEAQRKQVYNS
jgi:hypothetical protein